MLRLIQEFLEAQRGINANKIINTKDEEQAVIDLESNAAGAKREREAIFDLAMSPETDPVQEWSGGKRSGNHGWDIKETDEK